MPPRWWGNCAINALQHTHCYHDCRHHYHPTRNAQQRFHIQRSRPLKHCVRAASQLPLPASPLWSQSQIPRTERRSMLPLGPTQALLKQPKRSARSGFCCDSQTHLSLLQQQSAHKEAFECKLLHELPAGSTIPIGSHAETTGTVITCCSTSGGNKEDRASHGQLMAAYHVLHLQNSCSADAMMHASPDIKRVHAAGQLQHFSLRL